MASKVVQLEMFPNDKACPEKVMLGMMKGLFARDKQRDTDIKKLLELIMDFDAKIEDTKKRIDNIVQYESREQS